MRAKLIAFLVALSILALSAVPALAKGPGGGSGATCSWPYTVGVYYCPGFYTCVTSQPGWVSPIYYAC